jgi:hypothetical protein
MMRTKKQSLSALNKLQKIVRLVELCKILKKTPQAKHQKGNSENLELNFYPFIKFSHVLYFPKLKSTKHKYESGAKLP